MNTRRRSQHIDRHRTALVDVSPPTPPGWPRCTACDWPLNPAAAAGGHTTHPGCDQPTPPLATVHQLSLKLEERAARR